MYINLCYWNPYVANDSIRFKSLEHPPAFVAVVAIFLNRYGFECSFCMRRAGNYASTKHESGFCMDIIYRCCMTVSVEKRLPSRVENITTCVKPPIRANKFIFIYTVIKYINIYTHILHNIWYTKYKYMLYIYIYIYGFGAFSGLGQIIIFFTPKIYIGCSGKRIEPGHDHRFYRGYLNW